jgi:hypothetical protein
LCQLVFYYTSVKLAGKAGDYPSKAPFSYSTLV